MKPTGDSKAISKGISSGQYQKLGAKSVPKDGKMSFLDKSRYGSGKGILTKNTK